MKLAIFALVLLPLVNRAAAADLIVSARVINTGHLPDGREACRVSVDVINESQLPVTMYMMTCGWDSSWIVASPLKLKIAGWNCDKNNLAPYLFLPRRGYSFQFAVQARETDTHIEGTNLKVGYVCIVSKPRSGSMWSDMDASHGTMAWSNEFSVPTLSNHLLSYDGERRELPNQLLDPASPSVTPPAGAGGVPSVAADH